MKRASLTINLVKIFVILLFIPFVLSGYAEANQAVQSKSDTIRSLLERAQRLVRPTDIHTLIRIGILQNKAGNSLDAQSTFFRSTQLVKNLPSYSGVQASNSSLASNRAEYFILIAKAQKESGNFSMAKKNLDLATDSLSRIENRRQKLKITEHLLSSKVRMGLLELPKNVIEENLVEESPPKEKAHTLLTVAQAFVEKQDNEYAQVLVKEAKAQIRSIRIENKTSLSGLMVNLLIRLGRRGEAEEIVRQELKLLEDLEVKSGQDTRGSRVSLLIELAKGLAEIDDKNSSKEILEKALEITKTKNKLFGEPSASLRDLAQAKAKLGDIVGALEVEGKIKNIHYKNQSLPEIANQMIKQNDLDGAIELAKVIGKQDGPRMASVLEQVGMAMATKGDISGALKIHVKLGFPFKAGVTQAIATEMTHSQPLNQVLIWADSHRNPYDQIYAYLGIVNGLLFDIGAGN